MKKISLKPNFRDKRGTIMDIIYKTNVNHVGIIKSRKNTIRGNHYHKKTTQYVFIVQGKMEYWYKKLHSKIKAKRILLKPNDLIETPPYEIHAIRMLEDNIFVVMAKGMRGGKDYEKDTFRFPVSLINS